MNMWRRLLSFGEDGELDHFALRTGIFNALAYVFLVSVVTYGDSHMNHVVYGVRNYWLWYYVNFLSILILYFTYKFNIGYKVSIRFSKINYSFNNKPVLTFLTLIIPIFLLLWVNFRPEFPHMSIFQFSLGYAFVIASTVHTHNHRINFEFINNKLISESVKIERVKLEFETWFRLFVSLMAAYFLLNLYVFSQLTNLIGQITKNPGEQLLTLRCMGFLIFLGAFFSFFWFIELMKKTQLIKDQLLKIYVQT